MERNKDIVLDVDIGIDFEKAISTQNYIWIDIDVNNDKLIDVDIGMDLDEDKDNIYILIM